MNNKFLALSLLFLVGCSPGFENPVGGIWMDAPADNFSNGYANFSVKGDSVFVTHFLEFKGKPFFEIGKGKIRGDSLEYTVEVKHPIEGWATSGVHKLRLSAKGNLLKGKYRDNKGNTGKIKFVRQHK